LDTGEASAIALAMETVNSTLIIDEKKGRKFAKNLGLQIIGTLKILLLAKQHRLIPKRRKNSLKSFMNVTSGLQRLSLNKF
jgi:predicted nucleic acid-binding protein